MKEKSRCQSENKREDGVCVSGKEGIKQVWKSHFER